MNASWGSNENELGMLPVESSRFGNRVSREDGFYRRPVRLDKSVKVPEELTVGDYTIKIKDGRIGHYYGGILMGSDTIANGLQSVRAAKNLFSAIRKVNKTACMGRRLDPWLSSASSDEPGYRITTNRVILYAGCTQVSEEQLDQLELELMLKAARKRKDGPRNRRKTSKNVKTAKPKNKR